MNLKYLRAVSAAVASVLILCSCSSSPKITETSGKRPDNNQAVDISDYKLRDKSDLYKMDDSMKVTDMYLTVSRGNDAEGTNHSWSEINTYSVYDYERMGVDRYKVEGLLQIADENGPIPGELGYGQQSPNCTIQIRGQTSSRNPQKNYKISIKENKGDWRGQQTIALNKHMADGMRFRNKMAYDLISGIEQMMGLRTSFVHLYVKDNTDGTGTFQDYGLYTQVEQLNKTALKAHGMDKNGHLYKINFCEFYRYEDAIKLKDDPDFDFDAFEYLLETKGSDDHQKLINMLDVINDFSSDTDELLEKYFDIENLSYWMAFHILLGNIDTQSRNFYIYSPLNSDKWYFISWDNDAAIKRNENILKNRSDGGGWEMGVSNYWGNILFRRALKSEKYRNALDNAIEDLRGYLSYERLQGYVDRYSSVVKPYVYSMPDLMYAPLTNAQYDVIASKIPAEIELNYNLYKESYEKPMPFYIGIPTAKNDGKGYDIEWDISYDFDSENITYSFELARDYTFSNPLYSETGLVIPTYELSKLAPGQYFARVTATNSSGQSQYAFDYYVIDGIDKVYGTKCFYVNPDGSIVEDVYVEG